MKLLIISDHESKALWDYYEPGKLDDYDLIISCGDLAPQYLSFLATFTRVPVLYVHGNHDDCYEQTPPDGCICIENQIFEYRGLRIVGLGGSMRYKPGIHQYTERQMESRFEALRFRLWRKKGMDILVTHAPAKGLGDAPDLTHQGFQTFRTMLDRYHPAYYFHGHVHTNYGQKHPRLQEYNGTQIINAFERYVVEIPDKPYCEKPKKGR